jgi:hypothetical protein
MDVLIVPVVPAMGLVHTGIMMRVCLGMEAGVSHIWWREADGGNGCRIMTVQQPCICFSRAATLAGQRHSNLSPVNIARSGGKSRGNNRKWGTESEELRMEG